MLTVVLRSDGGSHVLNFPESLIFFLITSCTVHVLLREFKNLLEAPTFLAKELTIMIAREPI